jgi:NADH-quinone oxidoreductase subunit H
METLKIVCYILVYPGVIFMFCYGLFAEWLDRKLYARFQNRVGPLYVGPSGILQPFADFIKLLAKEDIVPAAADKGLFLLAPILGLAAVFTAALLLPVWRVRLDIATPTSFQGDVIVLAYLLSLPTFSYFLAGWASRSMFAAVGAVRVLTLLFSYEVPLFLAVLSPAVLAGTWRLAGIAAYYQQNPLHILATLFIGFPVAVICLQAKLERIPFDIPEAETELVGGAFTEYSGRKYGMFRLLNDVALVVGAGFLAAVFLGGFPGGLFMGFAWFILKTLIVVFMLSVIRSVFARIRIDQMVSFSWRYLAPLAVLQLATIIVIKGFLR